jgi:hypothetical protein
LGNAPGDLAPILGTDYTLNTLVGNPVCNPPRPPRDFSGIVKGKTAGFPMAEFKEIAKTLKRGHWRVATATIDGVELIAIVYRFSYAGQDKNKDRGVNYFITTCGSTAPGPLHAAHYCDVNGIVGYCDLQRPKVLTEAFAALPEVDKHDHARQNKLAVEEAWNTQSCWFRSQTTYVGICMTDNWKFCDHMGMLPSDRTNARIGVKLFTNMFCKKFFSKPGHKACKLVKFGKLENPEITDEHGHVTKKYKTDQYEKHRCYICKEQRNGPEQKMYDALHYCETCNPSGDTNFAICGEKCKNRQCFALHKMKVEYERKFPTPALPSSGSQ